MDNKSNALTVIPAELKNQLPIFQVLDATLPAPVKTEKGRKTFASILYWALIIGGGYWFFRNVDTLLAFAQKSVLFIAFSIVFIVLLLLMPKIVGVLHRVGRTILFKSEQSIVRNNPITAMQLLLNDAKDTLKRVKEKISHVDGVRIDMIQSGTHAQKTAEEKYNFVKKLASDASKQEEFSAEAQKAGNLEKSNDLIRIAKETRTKAFLLGKEGEAEEHNARSYAQYANQFSRVIEVLKDNESAARIYVSTLDSSISILRKKLEATQKMRNATEGLADVFNVKDGWVFQEAMNAATQAISQNIASIRSNLEFLDQNNNITVGGTPSQQELEAFVKRVDERHLTKLNVPLIASSSYELKDEERVDKGFTLLN
jgi:hypothetical protein